MSNEEWVDSVIANHRDLVRQLLTKMRDAVLADDGHRYDEREEYLNDSLNIMDNLISIHSDEALTVSALLQKVL